MEESNIGTEHNFPLGDDPGADGKDQSGGEGDLDGERSKIFRGQTLWGEWEYRNTIRSLLWFSRNWINARYPDYVSLETADRGIGISSGTLRRNLKWYRRYCDHLELRGNSVYVPSLIEQIRWIPFADAFAYLGMSRTSFETATYMSGLPYEWREFRRSNCVDATRVISFGIWKHVHRQTNRRLGMHTVDTVGALPADVLYEIIPMLKRPS